MTLTITTDKITSDRVTAYAQKTGNPDRWAVVGISTYTGRHLTRDRAIAAIVLAEYVAFYFDADQLAVTGPSKNTLTCLYCGSNDDIDEVLITIDDRHSEYALQCGICQGVWAQ